jgi:endo-beta-N-acetylglucosaminidase D
LWRILNLSSEFVSPIVKRRLSLLAESEVEILFRDNPRLQVEVGEQKQLSDKWKKRYFKMARLSVRKIQTDKFLFDENSYVLPVKL